MRAELATYGSGIPELMRMLCRREEETAIFDAVVLYIEQNGAMAFSEGWRTFISNHDEQLKEQELSALLGLADVLGLYAIEEQLAALEQASDVLCEGMEETRKKLREVSRLCMGASLSISLMLVILLL